MKVKLPITKQDVLSGIRLCMHLYKSKTKRNGFPTPFGTVILEDNNNLKISVYDKRRKKYGRPKNLSSLKVSDLRKIYLYISERVNRMYK